MGIEVLFLLVLLVFEIIFFLLAVFVLVSGLISNIKGAPYVPLPKKSVKRILEFSEISDSNNFYDLGCGDGRVLIQAVRDFGVQSAKGYEISPWPYLKAKFLVRRLGLEDKIKILRHNFLQADLSKVDTIFIYLYPRIVQRLTLKFSQELKPVAKIISVSFPIDDPEKFNLKLLKSGKADKFSVFVYQKI